MMRSPELWSPGFSPEGHKCNRQTTTDSDTGATAAYAAPVASISTRTQLRYGYRLWQIQISLKLQTARGTGDRTVYLVTDLNMTHYFAETSSLNALHVQRNTAMSLTELSFLIQVIRTTGLVHGQLAYVELFQWYDINTIRAVQVVFIDALNIAHRSLCSNDIIRSTARSWTTTNCQQFRCIREVI
jgi:hypothetical protein